MYWKKIELKISSLAVGILLVIVGAYFLVVTITDELPIQHLGYPIMGISAVMVIGALLIKNGVEKKKE